MKLTGAQALIKSLEMQEVEVMFGLPGGCILPAYDPIIGPPRAAFAASHGAQPNDPAKGAEAILAAIDQPDPPLHLPQIACEKSRACFPP